MGQPTGQRAMGRQLAIMGVPMTDKRAMGRLTRTAEWATDHRHEHRAAIAIALTRLRVRHLT